MAGYHDSLGECSRCMHRACVCGTDADPWRYMAIEQAIRQAMLVYNEPTWTFWARSWLNGERQINSRLVEAIERTRSSIVPALWAMSLSPRQSTLWYNIQAALRVAYAAYAMSDVCLGDLREQIANQWAQSAFLALKRRG